LAVIITAQEARRARALEVIRTLILAGSISVGIRSTLLVARQPLGAVVGVDALKATLHGAPLADGKSHLGRILVRDRVKAIVAVASVPIVFVIVDAGSVRA